MELYVPEPSTLPRRIRGLSVSVPLHVAAIAGLVALAARPAPSTPSGLEPGPVITYIDPSVAQDLSAATARSDRALAEERETVDTDGAERIGSDGFAFDIHKIRARQKSLFPFLTVDLMFLERVTESINTSQRKLVSPYASDTRRPRARPPLSLTEIGLQQIIDRGWSRRDRWKTFSEIATLITDHDPDEGRLPALLRGYLDQNLLQPFCDGPIRDPRFWAMLENAADHADFIDFVRTFARQRPSSKTTTELLFLIDEVAQGSRDVLLMLLDTHPVEDLTHTRAVDRDAYELAVTIRDHYEAWLFNRQIHTTREVKERYDALRLRVLSTIIETTPGGYRAADARFLAGEIAFKQGNLPEALRYWRGMTRDPTDAYAAPYAEVMAQLQSPRGPDFRHITRILEGVYGRWRVYSIDRLRQFGHACDTF